MDVKNGISIFINKVSLQELVLGLGAIIRGNTASGFTYIEIWNHLPDSIRLITKYRNSY